jgi:hypothetical protein
MDEYTRFVSRCLGDCEERHGPVYTGGNPPYNWCSRRCFEEGDKRFALWRRVLRFIGFPV